MKKSVKKDQKKRKGRKAGIIAAGVTVVLYAMLFPLYRIADFVICGLVAARNPKQKRREIQNNEIYTQYANTPPCS